MNTEKVPVSLQEIEGTIFDIERFSLHDGHGIRTVVFLKGCPLRCTWCANPESNDSALQIGFFPEKCAFCKSCVQVCPNGLVFLKEKAIPWNACIGCQKCVEACVYEARVAYGKRRTAGEVVRQVLRDRVFYENTGGGVTLSGGEVCLQPDFAAAILTLCQKEGIHTAIETSGFCAWEHFRQIIAHVDQLLFDFKCMDPMKHRQYTGVDNEVIMRNARLASELVGEMIIRWPVIPGVNDTGENAEEMAKYITAQMPSVTRVDLLPYHSTGKSKCARIGKFYRYEAPYELSMERVEYLAGILKEKGLDARIGG